MECLTKFKYVGTIEQVREEKRNLKSFLKPFLKKHPEYDVEYVIASLPDNLFELTIEINAEAS